MSSGAIAFTSKPLEDDARAINARDHKIAPGDISIGVIIGRTSEFFDFFVYAIASVIVFPSLVFPYVDALTGTLVSDVLDGVIHNAVRRGELESTAVRTELVRMLLLYLTDVAGL